MTGVVHSIQRWLIDVLSILRELGGKVLDDVWPGRSLWPTCALVLAASVFVIPSMQLRKLEKRVLPWAVSGWQAPEKHRIRTIERIREFHELIAANRMTVAFAITVGFMVRMATGKFSVALVAAVAATAATVMVLRGVRDAYIGQQRRSIRHELAAVTDFLALAVSAGLSVESALTQVPKYFRGVIAESIESREPCASGLNVLKSLAQHNSDARALLDALTVCEATGAPTAQVLHEQARSAADRVRADALAGAGRREVLMLIPVVFMVFPAVVLVAIFPGWQELRSSGW